MIFRAFLDILESLKLGASADAFSEKLDSCECRKMGCSQKGIESWADEVILELDKVFLQGHDFALDKLNLGPDHELRVTVTRPDEPSDAEKEEDEQEARADEGTDVQGVGRPLQLVTPNQVPDAGQVVEPSAIEKAPASAQETADQELVVVPTADT